MPARARTRWLLREPDPGAKALLFCFPYLGTGASMYHRWPKYIGPAEVCPLQPPGRENRMREPQLTDFRAVSYDIATELGPYLSRPYAFFAHCSSVFLGYEAALRTARYGLPAPMRLFISSMVAPDALPFGSVLDIPPERMGDFVAEVMRARGAELPAELLHIATGVMTADVEAYRRYRAEPGSILPCPVTVIAWRADTNVPPEATLGWFQHARATRVVLDGDHWAFLGAPPSLAESIAADLAADMAVRQA